MGSSPEMEAFEVTEEDLAYEFNPSRRYPRMTKNKATFGIWADPDSDDERPSFGKGAKKKDFTAPVNFISGGVKVGSKITKSGKDDNEEEDDGDGDDSDSDSEFDKATFKSQIMPGAGRGRGQLKKQNKGDLGEWERHTKGIGQKLLQGMGYIHGKGLGKNQQGIVTPVGAKKRMGKGTIGYYGSEAPAQQPKEFEVNRKKDDADDAEVETVGSQWKKGQTDKPKKPKYVYKTAEEIKAGGIYKRKKEVTPSELTKVKVIDMTGKEQRVMSGYHALANKHDRPDEDEAPVTRVVGEKSAFDMPELVHNLDILVETAGDDIIQSDRQLKYEKDMIVNLHHELEKTKSVCDQEEQQIKRLKDVMDIINKCEERSKPDSSNPLTLDDCAGLLRQLREQYYEEYRMYELWQLSLAVIFPLMESEFKDWDPMKKPRHAIATVASWKSLLEDSECGVHGSMDSYQMLLWKVWMPILRKTVQQWSCRSCEPLIEVIETWKPLLPVWMLCNILDQLVMPRLQNEVQLWNPLTDTVPIHAWLHPWLPLMGDRLEPLYAPIRHKLANALNNWHPSDPSAKLILEPWKNVFTRGHMEGFITKNILPKLDLCMQEFIINPHQQHLDAWNWVMTWTDMIPQPCVVNILGKHFFPRWLQALCAWLGSSPNYDEVTKWYMGWKSMFSDSLLAEPVVRDHFNKALEIMNRAVTGHYQPGARENVAYLTHTERRSFEPPPVAPPPPPPPQMEPINMEGARSLTASTSVPGTFRDLLERRAEECNLVFMPVANKTYEAKQVYLFGRVQIYLDRRVIFMLQSMGNWIPVSMEMLVNAAR